MFNNVHTQEIYEYINVAGMKLQMSTFKNCFSNTTQFIVSKFALINNQFKFIHILGLFIYLGMRLGLGKNSGKFCVAIDSNPIQHRRF